MASLTSRGRKRNIIESDDDNYDDDHLVSTSQPRSSALASFLRPSPKKAKTAAATSQSPRMLKSAAAAAASSTSNSSLSAAPATAFTSSCSSVPARRSCRATRHSRHVVIVASGSSGSSSSSDGSPCSSSEIASPRAPKRARVEEREEPADTVTLSSNQAAGVPASGTDVGANGDGRGNISTSATPLDLRLDDIFTSDPISEEEFAGHRASTTSVPVPMAQNRLGGAAPSVAPLPTRLLRSTRPPHDPDAAAIGGGGGSSSSAGLHPNSDHHRPWSERFGPVNLDELAVHKRKVSDVRRWLESVLAARGRQRLLILKGAAGSGKTTALRLLARDLGCDVLEWRNPPGTAVGDSMSASAKFRAFLIDGGRFPALDLGSGPPPYHQPGPASQPAKRDSGRKIVLIEEFPNTFAKTSYALTSFRATVREFLSDATPPPPRHGQQQALARPVFPVVMIISEALLATTSAAADSFTAHRLLGPEILRHPGTAIIEFNPIAPSILTKALQLLVQKEARQSGRKNTPGPQVLRQLGEMGDVRNAAAALEFLCLKGDHAGGQWGGSRVPLGKRKKSSGAKGDASLTRGEKESLQLVSGREASVGIFHAVGRVVYNKREEKRAGLARDSVDEAEMLLPAHLSHHARQNRSLVSVDALADEAGTDTHTFISALHENYGPSCEPTGHEDPSSPIDYMNRCLDNLSDTDLLCPSRDIFFGGRGLPDGSGFGRDIGSHVLRQDEMAFEVAVRGLLFSLPFPVRRKTSPTGRADAFKMFYPTSIKLWRNKEELEGLVDMWAGRLLRGGEEADMGLLRRDVISGGGGGSGPEDNAAAAAAAPLPSLGSATRRELVLERLPYMAHIGRAGGDRKGFKTSPRLRDLDRIVSFRGIGPPSEESTHGEGGDDDDEPTAEGAAWATDRPSEEAFPKRWRGGIRASERAGATSGLADRDQITTGLAVKKLVLIDDEIEHD